MSDATFFQDIADAYYSEGIHHLNKVRAVHDVERVRIIYEYIAKNLKPGKIEDKEDLISYAATFQSLQRVIGCLYEARPQSSCDWFLPLLNECYLASGIKSDKRKIFTMSNVMPQGYKIFYEALRNKKAPTIDIFIIPHMADFDLGSIAVVGHEVGHVLIEECSSTILLEIRKYLKDVNKIDDFFVDTSKTRKQKFKKFASHIHEYLCDMVGSRLFGPIFDLSFLRIFLAEANLKLTATHPAIIHRMKLALSRMLSINSGNGVLNNALNDLKCTMSNLCQECKNYTPTEDENNLEQLANGIFCSFFQGRIKPVDLDKAWEKVVPELNGFRPPCETVNNYYPAPITPREIVVASSLYYYGNAYKNNDFFKSSKLSEDQKRQIIKETLSKHMNYAIEISDFVIASHKHLFEKDQEESNNDLGDTLWKLRSREKNQLIVVPSISPKDQYSRNAIDLRLGSYFLVNKLPLFTHVQPQRFYSNEDEQISFEYGMFDPVHIQIGKEFILHPHQFILACTLEYVCLPADKYAFVLGRSTWGRLGLNIATATTVQPGFRGCLTLELRNLGETPLPLTVGTRIAQIAVVSVPDDMDNDAKEYFSSSSKYIGPVGVGLPKIKNDPDWKIIKAFTRE